MAFVAALIGLLLGGASADSCFGAMVGAVLGVLVWRTWRQAREIRALAQAVEALDHAAAAAPRAEPARPSSVPSYPTEVSVVTPAAPVAPPAEAPAAGHARPAAAEPAAATATAATAATAAATSTPAASASGPVPADPRWTAPSPRARTVPPVVAGPLPRDAASEFVDRLRALLFGGNTVAKAGIAILFIGLAFLAKYATEHMVVPVELRLAGIGAVAAVLMALGWRWRHARPGYAHVLQGGAVATWYLTLFVAFRFYGVIAAGPVFGLMLGVAALAAALAVLQDAPALAVIGALGGFATPLLTSTGHGEPLVLFSYYLLLDLGIAAVAWAKTWRALNLVGFLFTYGVGGAWGVFSYTEDRFAMSESFLVAYFLLFNAILLLPARRVAAEAAAEKASGSRGAPSTIGETAGRWVHGALLFGVPTVTFALQHGLVHDMRFGTAFSALALGAFYAFMARALRSRTEFALAFDGAIGVALVFVSLVIPFALDARDTVGAWSLEGAALVWIGFRQGRRLPRAFGYALLVLPAFSMSWAFRHPVAPAQWFNGVLLNALIAAAGMTLAARAVSLAAAQGRLAGRDGEAVAEPMLIAGAVAWALFAAQFEIDRFVVEPAQALAWAGAASAIALAAVVLRWKLDWTRIALPAIAHVPLLALALVGATWWDEAPSAHFGSLVWPAALAVHLVVLRLAARDWPPLANTAVHALGVLVLAGLLGLEGRHVTGEWGDAGSAWPWIGGFIGPALVMFALLRPALRERWPVSAAPSAYLEVAGGTLVTAMLLGTLLADLFCDGSARPLPYVPFANPLDVGVALALVMAWRWAREVTRGDAGVRTHATVAAARELARPMPIAIALAAFAWLNAMLVRGFHHYADVPFDTEAWFSSPSVQAGLAVLWTATALGLMWTATRRGWRPVWMAGAALLGLVVLKLVLVDLAASGTITRIVSFITVGVGMLVIGYVAPMPARTVVEEASNATR
jgi:uncharacterized membrane protein